MALICRVCTGEQASILQILGQTHTQGGLNSNNLAVTIA